MMPSFLRKFLNFVALGLLLLPMKNGAKLPKATTNHNGVHSVQAQDDEEAEILGVTDEVSAIELPLAEFGKFLVASPESRDGGIVADGERNRLLNLKYDEATKPALLEILKQFHPDFTGEEAENYLSTYKMLVGEDVDYYLETVRKGSWGTTAMSVNDIGEIHFKTISLRQFLIKPEYQETRVGSLNQLIQEEFFQAHQYEQIAAQLYNQGYFKIAGINTPQDLNEAVSAGNLRAFLELFPQQKYLFDTGYGRNSYNFYIGEKLFSGPASSGEVVNGAYLELTKFIEAELGIQTSPTTFLDPQMVISINDEFRKKYLNYFVNKGLTNEQVQIWNLVGLHRNNSANPENTLDMRALLAMPD